MKKIIYIFIFSCSTGYGQIDSLKSLLPLQIGNIWQYKITHVLNFDTTVSYSISEILKDTLIEGEKYFVINSEAWPLFYDGEDTLKYLRYDSLNLSVIRYSIFFGKVTFFKLDALLHDCWENVCCSLVDTIFAFGEYRVRKEFGEFEVPQVWGYSVVEDIGPISTFLDDSWSVIIWTKYDLVYAKINGIEYGSYVTNVKNELEIPFKYLLHQNYPNPFNPTTKINYQIPQTSFVTLRIYDLLGREVATLVNEEKPAGNYEVEFSAKGGSASGGDTYSLSSGIYFYKLQTENYSSVKKMILLK